MNQLPKRLTPLQTAIAKLKEQTSKEIKKNDVCSYRTIAHIGLLESLLESEQQLFSETWDASILFYKSEYALRLDTSQNQLKPQPDKLTFLSQFNQDK